jgi:hypothetical protein
MSSARQHHYRPLTRLRMLSQAPPAIGYVNPLLIKLPLRSHARRGFLLSKIYESVFSLSVFYRSSFLDVRRQNYTVVKVICQVYIL